MVRSFILAVIGVSLAVGIGPYAAAALHRMLGTSTVVYSDHNGTVRPAIIGVAAPQPDWVPMPPGAVITTGAHFLPAPGHPETGSLDIVTRLSIDELAKFYLDALRASGFDVTDDGLGTAAKLQVIGIDRLIQARNPSSGVELGLTIGSPEGIFIKSRVVQLSWRRS